MVKFNKKDIEFIKKFGYDENDLELLGRRLGRFLGYYNEAFNSLKKDLGIIDKNAYGYFIWEQFCMKIGITEVDLFIINDSDLKILNSSTKDEIFAILREIMSS